MIVLCTAISLAAGLLYGILGMENPLFSFLLKNTDGVLYVLMFSVGVSIGMHRGIVSKMTMPVVAVSS